MAGCERTGEQLGSNSNYKLESDPNGANAGWPGTDAGRPVMRLEN